MLLPIIEHRLSSFLYLHIIQAYGYTIERCLFLGIVLDRTIETSVKSPYICRKSDIQTGLASSKGITTWALAWYCAQSSI